MDKEVFKKMNNRKITWEPSLSGVQMYLIDSLTTVIAFNDVHIAVVVRSETRERIKNRTSYGIIFLLARRLKDLDDLSI